MKSLLNFVTESSKKAAIEVAKKSKNTDDILAAIDQVMQETKVKPKNLPESKELIDAIKLVLNDVYSKQPKAGEVDAYHDEYLEMKGIDESVDLVDTENNIDLETMQFKPANEVAEQFIKMRDSLDEGDRETFNETFRNAVNGVVDNADMDLSSAIPKLLDYDKNLVMDVYDKLAKAYDKEPNNFVNEGARGTATRPDIEFLKSKGIQPVSQFAVKDQYILAKDDKCAEQIASIFDNMYNVIVKDTEQEDYRYQIFLNESLEVPMTERGVIITGIMHDFDEYHRLHPVLLLETPSNYELTATDILNRIDIATMDERLPEYVFAVFAFNQPINTKKSAERASTAIKYVIRLKISTSEFQMIGYYLKSAPDDFVEMLLPAMNMNRLVMFLKRHYVQSILKTEKLDTASFVNESKVITRKPLQMLMAWYTDSQNWGMDDKALKMLRKNLSIKKGKDLIPVTDQDITRLWKYRAMQVEEISNSDNGFDGFDVSFFINDVQYVITGADEFVLEEFDDTQAINILVNDQTPNEQKVSIAQVKKILDSMDIAYEQTNLKGQIGFAIKVDISKLAKLRKAPWRSTVSIQE